MKFCCVVLFDEYYGMYGMKYSKAKLLVWWTDGLNVLLVLALPLFTGPATEALLLVEVDPSEEQRHGEHYKHGDLELVWEQESA